MNNPLVNKILIFALGLLGAYFLLRFGFWLVGLMMPFLIGFVLASIAYPLTRLQRDRLKFPQPLASLVSLLLVIGILGGILYFLFNSLQHSIPMLTNFFENLGTDVMISAENLYWTLQYRYPNIFTISFEEFIEQMRAPGNLLSFSPAPIISTVFNFARSLPGILLLVIITVISSYYISLEYTAVYTYLRKWLKKRPVIHGFFINIKQYTRSGLMSWLKAQAIIMTIAAIISTVFFLIMGFSNPLLMGVFLAFFDGLPLFGAGAILLPILLYHLIYANYTNSVLAAVLYILIVITRNFIEPRIIGQHIGINPLITLITIYTGFRLFGIVGLILGIILLVIGVSVYNGLKASKDREELLPE